MSAEASLPSGALLPVGNDAIYGIAQSGGSAGSACRQTVLNSDGCGTIYRLGLVNLEWQWAGVAYRFPGGRHGAVPLPRLTQYDGMIVGVTGNGGTHCAPLGCGTIYVFTP